MFSRSALEDRERDRYDKVWQDRQYGMFSPGLRSIGRVLERLRSKPRSVLFAGCGHGHAARLMQRLGFPVFCCDISEKALGFDELRPVFVRAPLWSLPYKAADFYAVYCADVLEHIPERMIDDCIKELARVCEEQAFIQVSTIEDLDNQGRPLHLTVKPAEWWLDKMTETFKAVEMVSNTSGEAFFYGRRHR